MVNSVKESLWFRDALFEISEEEIDQVVTRILYAVENKGRIFITGNGGSGNVAEHLVSDLVKGIRGALPVKLDAQCLNSNQVVMSAIGNDIGIEFSFSEQLVIFHADRNDLLITFSVSGTSPNIVSAINEAETRGMSVIAFVGNPTIDKNTFVCTNIQIVFVPVPTDYNITKTLYYGIVESIFSCLSHIVASRVRMKITKKE